VLRAWPVAAWSSYRRHKRQFVGSIDTAKRDEMKAMRLNEAIRVLTAGKPLGLK
jgi:hypothetical protein